MSNRRETKRRDGHGRRFGRPEIETARNLADRASHHFTDGDFEIDYTQPVLKSGDEEGLWVPCRLFVRFEEIEESIESAS